MACDVKPHAAAPDFKPIRACTAVIAAEAATHPFTLECDFHDCTLSRLVPVLSTSPQRVAGGLSPLVFTWQVNTGDLVA